MKIKHIFLLITLWSCNRNAQYEALDKKININFQNGYVMVLSDYDCINCLKKVTQTIEEHRRNNLKILYFLSNNKAVNCYPVSLIKNYPEIPFERIDKQLFTSISLLSSKGTSPFLLKIEQSHITDIISFTKGI